MAAFSAAAATPSDSLGHATRGVLAAQLPARTRPAHLLAAAEPQAPQGQQRRQWLAPQASVGNTAPRTEALPVRYTSSQLEQDYQREHFALLQTQARLRTAEQDRHQAWLAAAGLAAALLLALGLGWWAARQQRLRAERETQLRLRLAAELHAEADTLLTHVSQQADLLSQQQPELSLAHLAGTSRAAAHTMRDIVWSIDAQADTVGALVSRMREYLDQAAAPAGLLTEVHADGLHAAQRLRPELRQHLYLVFKEAVTNVLRHASRPTKVVVTLTCYTVANVLMLAIEDDGQPSAGSIRSGQGLRAMYERAQALRGTLEVGPQPQGGFRVWLQVPF